MKELGEFRGLPIFWKSKNGKHIIVYNKFDLGDKYKLYSKQDGQNCYSFNISFPTYYEIYEYAQNIFE